MLWGKVSIISKTRGELDIIVINIREVYEIIRTIIVELAFMLL